MLNKPIGCGTCGWVYSATQLALDRRVAVKLLREQWADDAEIVDRFHAEALATAKLSHPNIVSIIDHGSSDGLLFIVMEYLRGRSLGRITRRQSPLALDRALALFDQVLTGLGAAHAEGIIHADIKTDNMVVVSRLGRETVKLVDFGLARFVRRHAVQEPGPHRISGTAQYIAPETACGRGHTEAADIYSAGIVLYELLTGTTPFEGGSVVEILERHVHHAPDPPSTRRRDGAISPALDELVLRALAKQPTQRFLNAEAFRTAINKTRGVTPVRSDSEITRQSMAARVRRVGEAIAAGDPEQICARYLALAEAFARLGRHDTAAAELTEAIDLVTAGEGPGADTGPRMLWRVLVALAEAHLHAGNWQEAFATVWHARRHANRIDSSRARRQADTLMETLGHYEPPVLKRRLR